MKLIAYLLVGILMIVAAAACAKAPQPQTQTAPHIAKLAFGTNETAEPSMATFDIDDGIYVVAEVADISSKHNLFFDVTAQDVAEREQGAEIMTKNVELNGSEPAKLYFSVAYPGEYKVEATLSDESGKEIDKTFGMITVSGTAAPLEREREGPDDKDRDNDGDKAKHRDRK